MIIWYGCLKIYIFCRKQNCCHGAVRFHQIYARVRGCRMASFFGSNIYSVYHLTLTQHRKRWFSGFLSLSDFLEVFSEITAPNARQISAQPFFRDLQGCCLASPCKNSRKSLYKAKLQNFHHDCRFFTLTYFFADIRMST